MHFQMWISRNDDGKSVELPLKHSQHACCLITDSLLNLEKALLWGLCVLPRWVPGWLPALGMVLRTQGVLNPPSWCQERASLPAQTVPTFWLVLLKLFCGRWFVSWGNPCYLDPFFLLFLIGQGDDVLSLEAALHGLAMACDASWWWVSFSFPINISITSKTTHPKSQAYRDLTAGSKRLFYSLTCLHCCMVLPWLQVALVHEFSHFFFV